MGGSFVRAYLSPMQNGNREAQRIPLSCSRTERPTGSVHLRKKKPYFQVSFFLKQLCQEDDTFFYNSGKASFPILMNAWVLSCLYSQKLSRALNSSHSLQDLTPFDHTWKIGHLVFFQFLLQLKSQGLLILNLTVLLVDVELYSGEEQTWD